MSYEWDRNIYSNPATFGLKLIDSADIAGSYEFDIFAIWTDGANIFWAIDSGCSCPVPFEDYDDISDLQQGTYQELMAAIGTWGGYYRYNSVNAMHMSLIDSVNEWRRHA